MIFFTPTCQHGRHLTNENRNLQRQWRQWPPARAAALARGSTARYRLPAGTQRAGREISAGANPGAWLRRYLAGTKELERRRNPESPWRSARNPAWVAR